MTDFHGDELELSRFWNDISASGSSRDDALDPTVAAAVSRLHALTAAPVPATARDRVRRRLKIVDPAAAVSQPAAPWPVSLNGRDPDAFARRAESPTVPARAFWRRPVMLAAAVALLLIGLAGGWWWLGASRHDTGHDQPHVVIPAAPLTPTPTPDPTTYMGVLINTVIADQPLTSQYIDVEEYRLNPGYGFLGTNDMNGNFVELVTQGELTFTADQPTRVFRGLGGAPQTVPANTKLMLEAGDALAVGPRTTFKHEHNGNAPAVVISFNLLDPNIGAPSQTNDTLNQIMQANGTFKPGPLRLVVRRVSLAPGETFGQPASGIFMLTGPEDPASQITGFIQGAATNDGETPANLLVMTLEPVGEPTGTLVYSSASPSP